MEKKILILTMCCNQPLFQKQEEIIRTELYAKDIISGKYNNVEYLTYTASTDGKYHYNKKLHKLEVPCDDSLQGTYDKTIKTFKLLDKLNIKYDYIFRTNCSTYVNVEALIKFVNNIDNDKLIYTGGIYCTPNATGPFEWCFYGVGNSLLLPKYWINILINYPVAKFAGLNKVKSESQSYYNIDDNAIGLVINSYNYVRDNIDDMYNIWQSFKIPYINEIPKDPFNYIAIPFRQYTSDGNRDNEYFLSKIIHESILNKDDINNIPLETYKSDIVHIIDFDKHMHSIVSRKFADSFIEVMSIPKYIQRNKK